MIAAVEDVSVSLGGVSVLDSVSLSVERGDLLGLIGPNGAGKTTLLRTMNGLLDPAEGAVSIAGEDVAALSAGEASRRVATVPQDTTLSFEFSVREVVAMGRHPHRDRLGRDGDESAVDRALERASVADLADRAITEVSGGERSRVLLARALAQDTPLLLLDEPTASLDVNHQVRTLELLEGLIAEGKAAVAAIHDLDLAARYCDELALLSEGRIVARGPPEEVLEAGALGAAFDAPVVVSRDPVTGTPSVTALSDSADEPGASRGNGTGPDSGAGAATDPGARTGVDASDGAGHVHVVGGNGSAAGLLPDLRGAGFEVSVGVIREGDTDHEVAARLDCDVVSVPPFSPVDGATDRARDLARAADATLLADVAIGPENAANLTALAASDHPVVIEERPFGARNHAGASARDRYEAVRERARVTDTEEVVETVREACAAGAKRERAAQQ
ncbi:MAG: ATP-binding cassette domain-containing protein [Halobacteriales archaeon]